jgi:hypothetical protein
MKRFSEKLLQKAPAPRLVQMHKAYGGLYNPYPEPNIFGKIEREAGYETRFCGECAHFVRHEHSRTYFKCGKFAQTCGPGTDWRSNWPACGMFKPWKKD